MWLKSIPPREERTDYCKIVLALAEHVTRAKPSPFRRLQLLSPVPHTMLMRSESHFESLSHLNPILESKTIEYVANDGADRGRGTRPR